MNAFEQINKTTVNIVVRLKKISPSGAGKWVISPVVYHLFPAKSTCNPGRHSLITRFHSRQNVAKTKHFPPPRVLNQRQFV
jgi:hypothetical protein